MQIFKKDRKYRIIQSHPHLFVTTDNANRIAMVDTGYNGKHQRIPFNETKLPGSYKYHIILWVGSKYFNKIANGVEVDLKNMWLKFTNKPCINCVQSIEMSKSGKICKFFKFFCIHGDLVTIPVLINGQLANGFVDTGAPETGILRARAKKFGIELKPCASPGLLVQIQNQDIRFGKQSALVCLKKSNGVCENKVNVECGKNDPYKSKQTNKALANLRVSPRIDCVIGNDMLNKLSLYYFDYKNRIMLYKKGAVGDMAYSF